MRVARLKSVDSWMIMNCASEIWKPVQVQTGQDPEDVTEVSCDVLTELVGILDQC